MAAGKWIEYIVDTVEPHWTVCWERKRVGRFENRCEAMRAAVRDARRVDGLGHRVSVLVRRRDGALRPLPDTLLRSETRKGARHVA